MGPRKRKIRAFSLLEALVVLALIGLIAGMSAPLWGGRSSNAEAQQLSAALQEAVREARRIAGERGEGCRVVLTTDAIEVRSPRASQESAAPVVADAAALWSVPAGAWSLADNPGKRVQNGTVGGAAPGSTTLRTGSADAGVPAEVPVTGDTVATEIEIARVGADGVVFSSASEVALRDGRWVLSVERYTGRVRLERAGNDAAATGDELEADGVDPVADVFGVDDDPAPGGGTDG